ncbi:MAG: U32 family peptidase [Oscillospiraceae bacterium]|nr:U32 family peptidase [Oscillospiraceae bacterium]
MPTLEVLSPAGDSEKLRMAVTYGADAVYLAGPSFGMRAGAGCFGPEEMARAVDYCHSRGVKVYVTCNTIPDDEELTALPAFLEQLDAAGADAIIAADLGVMRLCQKYAPKPAIHISTQAGVMNSETARFFHDLGASRVVLAREMSLEQIRALRAKTPPSLDLEVFCHGAMCVSFSGRCLLSAYMTGRDANRGRCAQPCRWKYYLTEEKRPGAPMELVEDGGTYLYNARDLCMIDHLPALLEAGVSSIKIEGRTKSAYYAAAVTNAYRHGADAALAGEPLDEIWSREVYKVSHRPYSTGFFFGQPGQYTADACYFSQYDVMAMVEACDESGSACLTQRNRFFPGDELELLMPGQAPLTFTAGKLYDEEGQSIPAANHPKMTLHMTLPVQAPPCSFLRKQRTEAISGHGVEPEGGI